MSEIKVKWQAADGYAGGSRPHSTDIDASMFIGLDRLEAEKLFDEILDDDFRQKVLCDCYDYEASLAEVMEAAATLEKELAEEDQESPDEQR